MLTPNGGMTDGQAGRFGESEAPETCPECGAEWSHSERLHTGDEQALGGWEDWMFCAACQCELFYPVTIRPQLIAEAQRPAR